MTKPEVWFLFSVTMSFSKNTSTHERRMLGLVLHEMTYQSLYQEDRRIIREDKIGRLRTRIYSIREDVVLKFTRVGEVSRRNVEG